VILTFKTLICWNLLEKREPFRVAFLYEKALKKIFMRYASRLQHYLALKNEIFSSTVRAFYKNAQIFTTVRFSLLNFLAEKRRILGKKNGTPRA
jgi:hypothetical protein